jgi:hypothetical protein
MTYSSEVSLLRHILALPAVEAGSTATAPPQPKAPPRDAERAG